MAVIVRHDEPLFVAPNGASARRGAAALGARLPIYAAAAGPGCRSDWLLVGAVAWVCSDQLGISPEVPPPSQTDVPSPGLPIRYFFIGSDGAFGYSALESADDEAPTAELSQGFAVAVTDVANGPRGDPFARTTKGLWLPLRNLNPIAEVPFHGYEPVDGKLDRGWVVVDSARVHSDPGAVQSGGARLHRFDAVPILESRVVKGRGWVRIAERSWIDGEEVRIPQLAEPPDEALPGERWIDVDLANQVVTAYEGPRPVFTTLASTGVGRGDEPTATPLGVHRVWVKLRTTDMTNLEDEEARHYYAMQEVPWVLFFKKGYGFHGAFWHDSFGHVRSHGCVNLTPIDAEHLFNWSSPRLPAGWTAALPTDYDPGTLVRVR